VVEIQGEAGHASAPERAHNPLSLLPMVLPAIDRYTGTLPADPVLGRSTIAATMIETVPRSRNVIPDRVRIFLDWRVLPDMTSERAVEEISAALRRDVTPEPPFTIAVRAGVERQRTWTGIEEERRLFTPGFLASQSNPIVQAAVRAIADATGRTPASRPWTFATDGGHTCGVHGITTLGYAPGEERFAHTNRERLDLAEARLGFSAYPALISAVSDAAQMTSPVRDG
jgi:acetylornithine deacetylase/succinyl-diaminopimelate desuccinylase-like protein